MNKYYKITRRGVEDLYLTEKIIEGVLASQQQLVKINEPDGTFRLINKADIVDAVFDRAYSEQKEKEKTSKLYDKYLDKKTMIVKLVEKGTLPENLARYEMLQ